MLKRNMKPMEMVKVACVNITDFKFVSKRLSIAYEK